MKTPFLTGGLSRRFDISSLFFNYLLVFASHRHRTQINKSMEVNKSRRMLLEARNCTDEMMEATIGLLLMDHAEWLQREPRTTQEVMSRFGVPMLLPESLDDLQVQRISHALFDAGYTPFPKTHANPRWSWEGWPPAAAPSLATTIQPVYSSWTISKCPVHQLPLPDGFEVQRVERGLFIIAQRPQHSSPGGYSRRGWGMEYKGRDINSPSCRKDMGSGSITNTQGYSWGGGHA